MTLRGRLTVIGQSPGFVSLYALAEQIEVAETELRLGIPQFSGAGVKLHGLGRVVRQALTLLIQRGEQGQGARVIALRSGL